MKDFCNNIIFQMYKDNDLQSCRLFIQRIKEKYDLDVADIREIYRTIINYQVEHYGEQLKNSRSMQYIPKSMNRNQRHRQKDLMHNKDDYEFEKFLKRQGY